MARPLVLDPYFRSLRTLPGVGPRLQPLLRKLLDGECFVDLLLHAPVDLIDRRHSPKLSDIVSGQIVTLKATVKTVQMAPRGRPTRVLCQTPEGFFDLVYFNAPKAFLEQEFTAEREIVVSGKAEKYRDKFQIVHPDVLADADQFDRVAVLESVYPLTQGVSNRRLHNLIMRAYETTPGLPEWLETGIAAQEGWEGWRESLHKLHNGQAAPSVMQRLAYDEALAQQLTLALRRAKGRVKKGRAFATAQTLRAQILKKLPYELTNAQKRCLSEIDQDMAKPERMLRLMQGDVGSGKTIVALLAMLNAVKGGAQAAIMAPTDILAQQHKATIDALCGSLDINVALYTGRNKDDLQKAAIIIGTHALFQEGAAFRDLGLIVIDEQHRFGVEQRLKLAEKGAHCDILVMTATPIPRSLTLALYGDMDVSRLDEKPPTRKPVTTRLFHMGRTDSVIQGLHKIVQQNEQVFWVCPLIEESEMVDLAAAKDRYENLLKHFPGKVGLLHGRMKGAEKDAVMSDFLHGKISILVSTTVIEVGVDVPRATVMVVEQAERFGLAQLHQLRGRIGRGDKPSTCLLLYQTPIGKVARERLQIMRESEDGFVIAEKDLELRGGGEMLGTKQAGLPTFKFLDLTRDKRLIQMAQQDARMVVEQDPMLQKPRGQALRNMLYLYRCDTALQLLQAG